MADSDSVEIKVDTEVHVPSGVVPRRVIEAIRRQLRQHDLPADAEEELRRLLNLVHSGRRGSRLPQALLPRVTEVCRRHDIPFFVLDRRAMVACPALRSRLELSPQEEEALRQLLLRDSGVLVAAAEGARRVATDLISRRQQRTLVAAADPGSIRGWAADLARDLGLKPPHVERLDRATADTWVAVGSYDELATQPAETLRQGFGMVVCDELCRVDAVTLMRTVRGVGARYLLGLATEPVRADGLHHTLFTALGGIAHRISSRKPRGPLRLSLRPRTTGFEFPGYEGRRQYQALVAALARDPHRASAVIADVVDEASAGHPCLVLSERRDHLELLASLLPARIAHRTITSTVRLPERQRIISRFERGELTVLLATGQIAAESLCTPRLQRLFLTFPFSYARKLQKVVQSLMAPAPGQDSAVLFDYDDALVDPLHRAFVKRAEFLGKVRREAAQDAQLELF